MSIFSFLDEVSEVKKNESLTAFFRLKGTEEFLRDHFEDFPVMPGVLQLEAIRQAATRLLEESEGSKNRFRLSDAANVRFGQFVRPGNDLKIYVRLAGQNGDARSFEGRIDLIEKGQPKGRTLVADFTLVPAVV